MTTLASTLAVARSRRTWLVLLAVGAIVDIALLSYLLGEIRWAGVTALFAVAIATLNLLYGEGTKPMESLVRSVRAFSNAIRHCPSLLDAERCTCWCTDYAALRFGSESGLLFADREGRAVPGLHIRLQTSSDEQSFVTGNTGHLALLIPPSEIRKGILLTWQDATQVIEQRVRESDLPTMGPLTIQVATTQDPLRVTYFKLGALAASYVLEGRFPPALATSDSRLLRVLRNPVLMEARRYLRRFGSSVQFELEAGARLEGTIGGRSISSEASESVDLPLLALNSVSSGDAPYPMVIPDAAAFCTSCFGRLARRLQNRLHSFSDCQSRFDFSTDSSALALPSQE